MGNPISLRASIIVLCYNGLEAVTRPCVESILRNTAWGDYELLLVDNASGDGTPLYLQEVAGRHEYVKLCLNSVNKGYAGGNNDGMRMASGEFVVLLNNDTLVPSGWLERLLSPFAKGPTIGMVGPVTNSAGNEQQIELPGLNENNFETIAADYSERQRGVSFEAQKLGFFCMAMRRPLIDKVGYLDEKFGIGMFEDDDYCLRVRLAGYKLVVAEDCFVFHQGSASFSKLTVGHYRDVFETNKAYYRSKHQQEWTLTDLALSYWNRIDQEFGVSRGNELSTIPGVERVQVRLQGFRRLLLQIMQLEAGAHSASGVGAPPSSQAKGALREARWNLMRRNLIHGTNAERWRFVRRVGRRLLDRLGPSQGVAQDCSSEAQGTHAVRRIIDALYTIREGAGEWSKVIIIPATVDFVYMHQRPQSLAEAFARAGYLVVYGTLNFWGDDVEIARKVEDRLYVVNENWFPLLSHAFKPDEVVYYCMWPNNAKHLGYLPYGHVLYDYMDEISLLNIPVDELLKDHHRMMERADFITVTSRRLLEKIPPDFAGKAVLLPNAVADRFIHRARVPVAAPPEIAAAGYQKVIGYYGALAEWVDFDLIDAVAETFADALVILIGPVDGGVEQRVAAMSARHSNVCVLPPKKQFELIAYLQAFDVCIIPFKKNEVTDAVSPVKLFEYFSAGKPVVATNIDECASIPLVKTCEDAQAFIAALGGALLGSDPEAAERYVAFAGMNTWGHRVATVESQCLMRLGDSP